ncbi:MAG: mechanosensitive ion channel [Prevotellaceae bacterium]|nr:mechanosensitive ion channel [Prevotellaceae bacterium]
MENIENIEKNENMDFMKELSEVLSENALNKLMDYGMQFGKNILAAIVIYLVGKYIIGKLTKLVRKVMQKKAIEPSLYSFLDSLMTICLYFVLIIAIVGVLGIETSSFVALFASAGVAIGMAMSGTLQNFAGGVMILLFRPFRVGDVIEAQGFCGAVKHIQIFNTVLTTVDNQTIIIPNGGLSTGSIKNYSTQPNRRVDINVEVAYGTKPEDVRKILFDICKKDSRILSSEGLTPTAPMISMGSSSIILQLRAWTESANYWGVMGDTTEAIYNRLTEAGIEIPFQQIDIHMKN